MKGLLVIILSIWITGAGVMTLIYEYERKVDCVEREGIVKGLIWCDTDATTQLEMGVSHFSMMIKGLGWPFRLFANNEHEKTLAEKSHNEKLSAIESAMKKCGYHQSNPTTQAKKCVQETIDSAYGARNKKEGDCTRASNPYLLFAQERDTGAPLIKGLNFIESDELTEMTSEMSIKMGVRLDEEEIKSELKEVLYFVYSHPETSAQAIRDQKYSECMALSNQ